MPNAQGLSKSYCKTKLPFLETKKQMPPNYKVIDRQTREEDLIYTHIIKVSANRHVYYTRYTEDHPHKNSLLLGATARRMKKK
jgi:hypothetical protein